MGPRRALFYAMGRIMAALAAGFGLAWDYTGQSISGLSPSDLGIIGLVAFVVFVLLTLAREIELYLHPHPRIVWNRVILERGQAMKWDAMGNGTLMDAHFVRLTFLNKARTPSGAESTAKAMTALVRIDDRQSGEIDFWEGRWANNDKPYDVPSKWSADRLDLDANNQEAILDIGLRYEGDAEFYGWDNGPERHSREEGPSARGPIGPGSYNLQVKLAASNMRERSWRFMLNIPQGFQSDRVGSPGIMLVPVWRRGSRREGSPS